MAISYSINGRSIPTVPVCQWPSIQNSQTYNDILGYSPWYRHIWRIPSMIMSDYEYLDGLRGSALINIGTTDKVNPNTQKSYTDARLVDISGIHIGLNMNNVIVEFLVKVA